MFRRIRHDEAINVLTLISNDGRIDIPYGTILMVRQIYRVDPNKMVSSVRDGCEYSFVGRIMRSSNNYIGFEVLASEDDTSEYKFSTGIFLYDHVVCREFKLTGIPRIINWSWIGIELNCRYFKEG